MDIYTQKTKTHLVMPITDKMRKVLDDCKKLKTTRKEKVFGNLTMNSYFETFERYRKVCGIQKHLRFHLMRDTFANSLISNGVDIFTTSKLLTHASVNTTQKAYVTDANIDMVKSALSKL